MSKSKICLNSVKNKIYYLIYLIQLFTGMRTGERIIPIPRMIRKMLKERVTLTIKNGEEVLFLTKNGNFIDSRDANKKLKKSVPCLIARDTDFLHTGRGEYSTFCTISFDILSLSAFAIYFTEHFCGTFKVINALKFRIVTVFFH